MTDKQVAEMKRKHAVHVNLIMIADDVSKNQAQFRAWIEGPDGFNKRLTDQANNNFAQQIGGVA